MVSLSRFIREQVIVLFPVWSNQYSIKGNDILDSDTELMLLADMFFMVRGEGVSAYV